ncbi:hypothetical protein KFL_004190120 [Klebsormidium nitens]|uniref:Uncharacterized protein n=1 Tax=Klebsormidium nitens TaxID=105231 RepID=A0A1Y1ICM6_KLENI|nr:hypothetical protein KFL_004190120 [Klebsormidium nitens]|eukprot:GAQ88343.1 hypothetical protein KFL_004190120 [Klebsormidium nitens]
MEGLEQSREWGNGDWEGGNLERGAGRERGMRRKWGGGCKRRGGGEQGREAAHVLDLDHLLDMNRPSAAAGLVERSPTATSAVTSAGRKVPLSLPKRRVGVIQGEEGLGGTTRRRKRAGRERKTAEA